MAMSQNTSSFASSCLVVLSAVVGLAHAAVAGPVVRRASGADASAIQAAVDQFRGDLGGSNNGNAPTPFPDGRREINWDGVPDASAAPATLPGDSFRGRGAIFTTPGTGFQVSMDDDTPADVDADAVRFAHFSPDYASRFVTFSSQRLFAPVGSVYTDVTFRVPGTDRPASVKGFGVVFTDVTLAGLTTLEFYDPSGRMLAVPIVERAAPVSAGGLSFVGVSFDAAERVARVRIRSGITTVSEGLPDAFGDVVAMDDFVYGEPQALGNQPAAIDTSFAGDGLFQVGASISTRARAVLLQPDGKALLIGPRFSNQQLALVRLNVDGTLDTTFDGDGVAFAAGRNGYTPRAAALQADGRVIVVGDDAASFGATREFAVMRFTPDGALDPTFDGDGRVQASFAVDAEAHGVAIDAAGRIVVAGQAGPDVAVLRLLADGTLDATFHPVSSPVEIGNGLLRVHVGSVAFARAIEVRPDGTIVVGGGVEFGGGTRDFLALRLLDSGALDFTFDSDGWTVVDFGAVDTVEDLVALPDGRLVLAGSRDPGVPDFAVARLLPGGALDEGFNPQAASTLSHGNGRTTIDFGAGDYLNDAALQADGAIVLVGWTEAALPPPMAGTTPNVATARITSDGIPDVTFAPGGRIIHDWYAEEGDAVAIRPDGRIVVAGYSLATDTSSLRMSAFQLLGGPLPGIFITTPSTDSTATAASPFITIKGTAVDDVAVAKVTWVSDRGFAGTAEGTSSWSSEVPLVGGVNLITVTVEDAVGNVSHDTVTITVDEFRYFLSEGATGPFFDVDILIANPTETPADVAIAYLKPDGTTVPQTFSLPAQSRRTVKVDTIAGLENTAVSTVVRSTNAVPIVVERTMFWDDRYYGGHTGSAVDTPRTQWYFGEGNQGFFDTYVLLANANDSATTATVTFLVEGGPNVIEMVALPATARVNVYAGLLPALVGKSFSVVVTSALPIIAERAMYFGNRQFEGGHESPGVGELATTWFHAEGATGDYFDTYILVGNPNPAPANLTVTFLKGDGTSLVRTKVVPANGRFTLFVDGEDPALADTAVSTTVVSDLPIVSERAMYWAGTSATWFEAHNSFGVTRTGQKWALAEGRVGQSPQFETYVLLANPSTSSAQVRATFLRASGASIVKTYNVAPTSRFNIWVNAMVPELADEDFGVLVEVLNGVDVAVERALYWHSGGVDFAGGTNATAVRVP
jgi:uncharacterized delta-60 repeat protein